MTRLGLSLLFLGLACTTLGAALLPLPVSGLLSEALFALGFVLSVIGLLDGPKSSAASAFGSTGIAVLGLLLLSSAAFLVSLLSHYLNMRLTHPGEIIEFPPPARDWLKAAALALSAALCVAFGVTRKAGVSALGFVGWAAVVFAVPPLALGLFVALARLFP